MSLTTNTTSLQSILDTVNALPPVGSGGGGGASIQTCTVEFLTISGSDYVCATVLTGDGEIGVQEYRALDAGSLTVFDNVVCNSIFIFVMAGDDTTVDAQGASVLYGAYQSKSFQITAAGGGTANFITHPI